MMTETAYEWGLRHESCTDALEMRHALGSQATQADWYLVCDRGDWLIWQLQKLKPELLRQVLPGLLRASERIVTRAIGCGQRVLRGIRADWATQWRRWAKRWLTGEDRSAGAARAARAAAKWTGAQARAAREAAEAAREAAEAEAARAVREAAAAETAAAAARAAAEAAEAAAALAAAAAAWTEARAVELRLQAEDIHREIPEWPEE